MQPKTNYSVISKKSDFLKHIVTKHILKVNQDAGIYPTRSMFGAFIMVGDKENPIPNKKFVISSEERPDFKTIDLDEDPLPHLYEVLGIESREFKTLIRNRVYKRPGVTPNSLYYYMILLSDCIKEDGSMNMTKSELIIDTYKYQSKSSTFEKYKALNSYVTSPTEENLFTLIKVYSDIPDLKKRFTNIAYTIKSVLDSDVPDYITSRITFSQDPSVIMNYLILASEVATFEDFDSFISKLISKLV